MAWFEFQTRAGRRSSGFTYVGWGGRELAGRVVAIRYCEGHEGSPLSWAALDDDFHFSLVRGIVMLAVLLGLAIQSRSRQN